MRCSLVALLLALAACAGESVPPVEPLPELGLSVLDERAAIQIDAAREALDPASSKSQGRLGMLLHAYDLRAPAMVCYRNARRLAPEDGRWSYYLALILRDDGDLEAARETFAAAETRLTDAAQLAALRCQIATLELAAGRPATAAALYRQVLAADPDHAAAQIGLGQSLLAQDDAEGAIPHLKRAADLVPAASNALYLLGMAYRQLGRAELAQHYLQESARPGRARLRVDDPLLDEVRALADSAYLFRKRGNDYFRVGDLGRAIPEYEKAITRDPEDATTRANLGAALARVGQVPRAEEELRKALLIDARHTTALFNLATLLARRGQDAEAVALYERALAADPDYQDCRFNLANARARLGEFERARAAYAAVIAAQPGNGAARRGEARMLSLLGRDAEAGARLEAWLETAPDDREAQHDLARILVASPDDAVRDGARGLAIARRLFERSAILPFGETLAMAYAETGSFAEAVTLQRRLVTAARKARRGALAQRLEAALARYEAEQPCRTPWRAAEVTSPAR